MEDISKQIGHRVLNGEPVTRDGRPSVTGARLTARFRSVRAVRRFLERVMAEAYAGKRPIGDIPRFAAGAKFVAEAIMAENLLRDSGGDIEVDASLFPGGDDGGELTLPEMGQYVQKKLTIRDGKGKFGADERTVTRVFEGPAGDDGAEGEPGADGEGLVEGF